MSKHRKPKRATRVIGSIAVVLIVIFVGFTVVSHAVWHRSNMATVIELLFRIQGTRDKYTDPAKTAAYIEKRRNAPEYTLRFKLKSTVSESAVSGCRVYTLSGSDAPEYTILYLHGGAYINDASYFHWRFCDKLVRRLNAEIVFPIYPLTPDHTWAETLDLLTTVYCDILDTARTPVVIMGDSAGGGLAVAFCEYAATLELRQPDKLILFSPWMDVSMSNPELADYEAVDPRLSAGGLVEIGKCWAGELDIRDYRVSPIFGDMAMLDNVTLFVGTRELLYPDVTRFYEMLEAQGSAAELYIGEGLNHVYPLYPIPEADEAIDAVCEAIRR